MIVNRATVREPSQEPERRLSAQLGRPIGSLATSEASEKFFWSLPNVEKRSVIVRKKARPDLRRARYYYEIDKKRPATAHRIPIANITANTILNSSLVQRVIYIGE